MKNRKPETEVPSGEEILLIPANLIRRNGRQPRQTFIEAELVALADSIREKGQRVPIEVKRLPRGFEHEYEIIDGESRWRSVCTYIDPAFVLRCVVTTVKNEEEQFERSLVANMHRSDLSPLDTAFAIKRECREFGKSIEYLAKLFGKSRAWVDNYLLLTTLPKEIRDMMDPNISEEKRLNVTIAIFLVKIKDKGKQLAVAQEVVREGLSLRAVIALVRGVEPPIGNEKGDRYVIPKPKDLYGSILGLVVRVSRRLADYELLNPNLEQTVTDALAKRQDKKGDAEAIILFCDKGIAVLEKIRKAAKN